MMTSRPVAVLFEHLNEMPGIERLTGAVVQIEREAYRFPGS